MPQRNHLHVQATKPTSDDVEVNDNIIIATLWGRASQENTSEISIAQFKLQRLHIMLSILLVGIFNMLYRHNLGESYGSAITKHWFGVFSLFHGI
jgi:hypothetical protein